MDPRFKKILKTSSLVLLIIFLNVLVIIKEILKPFYRFIFAKRHPLFLRTPEDRFNGIENLGYRFTSRHREKNLRGSFKILFKFYLFPTFKVKCNFLVISWFCYLSEIILKNWDSPSKYFLLYVPRYLELPLGSSTFDKQPRMHYIDESNENIPTKGIILCLHGEPTWSFLYRYLLMLLFQ